MSLTFNVNTMGTVLRMLSNYVGEDRFLKGVSIYLKNKLYGNSVTTDLWDGISKATGIDVPKVMDNWVTKVMKGLERSENSSRKCHRLASLSLL